MHHHLCSNATEDSAMYFTFNEISWPFSEIYPADDLWFVICDKIQFQHNLISVLIVSFQFNRSGQIISYSGIGLASLVLAVPGRTTLFYLCTSQKRSPSEEFRAVLPLPVATNYVIYNYTFIALIRHTTCSIHIHQSSMIINRSIIILFDMGASGLWIFAPNKTSLLLLLLLYRICPEVYFRWRWNVKTSGPFIVSYLQLVLPIHILNT